MIVHTQARARKMRRLRLGLLVAVFLASSMICAGSGLLVVSSQRSEVSLASIPLYPRTMDVSASGAPTDNIQMLIIETLDSEQSVHNHYASVLTSPVWTAFTKHPYPQKHVEYTSMGMPDFGKVQLHWDPGSPLPTIEIPRQVYSVQVQTGRLDNTTEVWVTLTRWFEP